MFYIFLMFEHMLLSHQKFIASCMFIVAVLILFNNSLYL